jgi:hypothetical protein
MGISLKVSVVFWLGYFTLLQIATGELDYEDMYPIIINTQSDKAVLILPEKGCHVILEAR